MPRYDQSQAECHVLTFTEGILASFAHQLRIRIDSFVIDVDIEKMEVQASFDPASLHVECIIRDEDECSDLLTDEDRETIDNHIRKDILDAEFYEQILFRSTSITRTGKDHTVKGILSLVGTEKEISFPVRDHDDHQVATISLHQPDFGIKPFSTMAGTIRVKPDVRIKITVPISISEKRPISG